MTAVLNSRPRPSCAGGLTEVGRFDHPNGGYGYRRRPDVAFHLARPGAA